MKQKDISIEDLKFDEHNFNSHTEEGLGLLEKSITENKFGRSVLVDKDNNIIAGNGVIETARKLGKKKIKVIETDGEELVVVKRKDLAIDSKEGRSLALADNSIAHVDLKWNEEEIKEAEQRWNIDAQEWGVDVDVALEFADEDEISEENYKSPEKHYLECPSCHHRDVKEHFKSVSE